ncbi:MAG: class I SAM-dependent methyltransferase [Candidatus Hodarchaeota archaeon]
MCPKEKNSNNSRASWDIKTERPEELCKEPSEYWTNERIQATLKAKNQARIQHKLSARTLEHLRVREPRILDMAPCNHLVLDIGCGLGFSSDILLEEGNTVVGIDLIQDMLESSLSREHMDFFSKAGLYHLVLASAVHPPFRDQEFSHAISISALQWVRDEKDMQGLASELSRVINREGYLSFQYYPQSREAMLEFGNLIKDAGFEGGFIIDDYKNPKKRKVFLIMKKKEIK